MAAWRERGGWLVLTEWNGRVALRTAHQRDGDLLQTFDRAWLSAWAAGDASAREAGRHHFDEVGAVRRWLRLFRAIGGAVSGSRTAALAVWAASVAAFAVVGDHPPGRLLWEVGGAALSFVLPWLVQPALRWGLRRAVAAAFDAG